MANSDLRKRFFFFLVLTLLVFFTMRWATHGLSGRTIIDFEMAKTPQKAIQMVSTWTEAGVQDFLHGVWVDFLFIIAYAGTFFYGARFLGQLSGHYILRKAGVIFSFFALLAGFFDVIENTGMLTTLYFRPISWVTHLTYDMAVLKFSLLLIVLLLCIISLLFWALDAITRKKGKLTL